MEEYKKWLGQRVSVTMDRPLGSAHPKFPEAIYPVNYGFIPGTFSEYDQEEVDAYVFGPTKPLAAFTGMVIAIIVRHNAEIKLVVSAGEDYSIEEIEKIVSFQEKYHRHMIYR